MNVKTSILSLVIMLTFSALSAQEESGKPMNIARVEVTEKDTLATFNLDEVLVFTKREFENAEDRRAFERLKRNTLKVYPYVQIAVEIYNEMSENTDDIKRRRKRKKYVKEREDELRAQFEEEIRNLTKTQGKILVQLINRETGNSCYDIVKEMRGPFTAFFWQLTGRLFGHNLKEEYFPEENPDLEFIVKTIKSEPL